MPSTMLIAGVIAISAIAPASPANNNDFDTMRFDTPLTQTCSYALKHTQSKAYNPEGIWHGCYDYRSGIVIDEKGTITHFGKSLIKGYRKIYKSIHYDFTSAYATEKGYRDATTKEK